ncbi:MAG TPA: TonB-dependent receptor [Ohtaekwangia sp.]|nr:TonB-dependent receptor [Ohtaekwangia sp.]
MASRKTDNFSWDFSAFSGKGIVSDAEAHQDPIQDYENENLGKVSKADPVNLNLGLKYKRLSFRAMYDQFETTDPFVFVSFKSFFTDLNYQWKVNDKLTVTPQVKYSRQVPWTYGSKEAGVPDFEVHATRLLSQLDLSYDISRKINVNFGGLFFQDKGDYQTVLETFTGERNLTLNNPAFYAQGLFRHRLANATIGFRYEKNNRYDGAFVPRPVLTKKIENFHFKVLYSQAFRAPSLQNINIALNDEIKPEKFNVFEVELGYQFTPETLLAVNFFSITTKNVMIYNSTGVDDTFDEWYENSDKSGSRGVELVYSIRQKTGIRTLHTLSVRRSPTIPWSRTLSRKRPGCTQASLRINSRSIPTSASTRT